MKKEYEFLANNPELLSQYRGKWIAVIDENVIAHGKVFKEVADEAREVCTEPTFMYVPKDDIGVYNNV